MAKKFNVIYEVAKETAYSTAGASLVLAASMNSVVQFNPILAPNGVVDFGVSTASYNVQRIKRIKATAIANPNTGSTSAALAALDTFSKVEWESINIATGALMGVGVKTSINEQFDIDSIGEGHAKAIKDAVNIQLIERHEGLIDEAYSAGTDAGALAFTAGSAAIFDKLSLTARKVMLLSDEIKHMTDKSNMLIVMHPSVADLVAKEIGTVFNQEAPIYRTGMKSQFSLNGIPVIIDTNLNKYQDTDSTKRLGAIVMDVEAIAFKAANESKPVSVNLGLTQYNGTYFFNITKAIDPARIFTLSFDASSDAAITDKASA